MESFSARLPDSLQQIQKSGWDFLATGTRESNWKLQFNHDDSLQFWSGNGLNFTVRTPQPVIKPDGLEILINNTSDPWVISIKNHDCKSGENVSISGNGHLFTGCGNYLLNNSLHGTWELFSIGRNKINTGNSSAQLPLLQIDLNRNEIKGHDGCNYYSSRVSVVGKRINFSSVKFKKGNLKGNCLKEYFERLANQSLKYSITGNTLEVTLNNDLVLYFRRVFGY